MIHLRTTLHFRKAAAIVLIGCNAGCAGNDTAGGYGMPSVMSDTYATAKPLPMEPSRTINEQDCSKEIVFDRGNILCK